MGVNGGYCVDHGQQKDGTFCQHCGVELVPNPLPSKDGPFKMAGNSPCPGCGYELDHGHQAFCPGCGHQLQWTCR